MIHHPHIRKSSDKIHHSSCSIPNPLHLQIWLSLLCILAASTAVRSLFFPRWPLASPLIPVPLSQAVMDANPKLLPFSSLAPQRSFDRSLSTVLRWRFVGGHQLSLLHVAVRQRENYNLFAITKDHTEISLGSRRQHPFLKDTDSGTVLNRQALQTCLVLGSYHRASPATSGATLAYLSDLQSRETKNILLSLLGIKPLHTYQCLLVTLTSLSSRPVDTQLWQRLLPRLQEAYSHSALSLQ